VERRSVPLSPPVLAEDQLGYFRWGQVAGKILVTNDAGDWLFLSAPEFEDLLAGRVGADHPRLEELQRKSILRDGLDLDALGARVGRRTRHARSGPHLHIMTLTGRCSQACTYCQAGQQPANRADVDMSRETAEKVVDLALQSTSPSITFVFQGQGGEPLLNFDVLRHAADYARTRGQDAGKALGFAVLSNFTGMTEEAAEWLLANDVRVTTSLDGPANVHNANRSWKHGSAHSDVVRWLDYFKRRCADLKRDPQLCQVDALLTTTRQTLAAWRDVVDEYVARGLRTICIRPLNPFGFARSLWPTIGYTPEEYLDFYQRTLDYILELNRRGTAITEGTASIFLTKILSAEDPGALDIQSPCGAGMGQVAYNFDGRVFPSDEARIVDATGDPMFRLGHVQDLTIEDIVRHPTVRAIAAASLLDAQPMCADCWNKPFCGISPVYNYLSEGDLFGQRPRSLEHKEHLGVSTRLFELLADEADTKTTEILQRWIMASAGPASDGRASKEAP
jgi:His-Xaa-Ser system radical SAM maturase HxsB